MNKLILLYFIALLFFFGCTNPKKTQSIQFYIGDESVELNFLPEKEVLKFISASKLGIEHQFTEMYIDTLNKTKLIVSYIIPQNGEYEFWSDDSNFHHLVESRVPVECGLLIGKQSYKFEKGLITDAVVIMQETIYFSKVISIYTKIDGVFTIRYSTEYERNEVTLEDIMLQNSFMNDLRITYNTAEL